MRDGARGGHVAMTDGAFCALEMGTLSDMVETCTAGRPEVECKTTPALPGFVGLGSAACRSAADRLNSVIESFTLGRNQRRGRFSCSIEGFMKVDSGCMEEASLLAEAFGHFVRGSFADCTMTTSTTTSSSSSTSATTSTLTTTSQAPAPTQTTVVPVQILWKGADCGGVLPAGVAELDRSVGNAVGAVCGAAEGAEAGLLGCRLASSAWHCGSLLGNLTVIAVTSSANGTSAPQGTVVGLLRKAVDAGAFVVSVQGRTLVATGVLPYTERIEVTYLGDLRAVAPDLAATGRLQAAVLAKVLAESGIAAARVSDVELFTRVPANTSTPAFGVRMAVRVASAADYLALAPQLSVLEGKKCTGTLALVFDGVALENTPPAPGCDAAGGTAGAPPRPTTTPNNAGAAGGGGQTVADSVVAVAVVVGLLFCLLCAGTALLAHRHRADQQSADNPQVVYANSNLQHDYLDTHPDNKFSRGAAGGSHYYPVHVQGTQSLAQQGGWPMHGAGGGRNDSIASIDAVRAQFDAANAALGRGGGQQQAEDEYLDVQRRLSAAVSPAHDEYIRLDEPGHAVDYAGAGANGLSEFEQAASQLALLAHQNARGGGSVRVGARRSSAREGAANGSAGHASLPAHHQFGGEHDGGGGQSRFYPEQVGEAGMMPDAGRRWSAEGPAQAGGEGQRPGPQPNPGNDGTASAQYDVATAPQSAPLYESAGQQAGGGGGGGGGGGRPGPGRGRAVGGVYDVAANTRASTQYDVAANGTGAVTGDDTGTPAASEAPAAAAAAAVDSTLDRRRAERRRALRTSLAHLSDKVIEYVHVMNGGSDDNTIDADEWRRGCEEEEINHAMDVLMAAFPEITSVDTVFQKLHRTGTDPVAPLNVLQIVSGFRSMSERVTLQLD